MKYCVMCGIENFDDAVFCNSCGAKFEENISTNTQSTNTATNQNPTPQYYGQPYTPKPPSKNIKPSIAIIAIGITVVLIFALLYVTGVFPGGASSSSLKIPASGGPRGNLQSLTSGNTLVIPDIDHTAVFGYYVNGFRLGSLSFTNKGEESYLGETCYKIQGTGIIDLELYNQSIEMNININGYEVKSDSLLIYYNYDLNMEYLSNVIDMIGTITVDKENGQITSTSYSSLTGSTSAVIEVPSDFWTKTNLQDNLYVGYFDEVNYTININGSETDVNIKISVNGQQDVTVTKGTFEDCYIVVIEQTIDSTTTTSYMWVDENFVCPKMQIPNSTASVGYGDLTMELEEYYTT